MNKLEVRLEKVFGDNPAAFLVFQAYLLHCLGNYSPKDALKMAIKLNSVESKDRYEQKR